MSMIYSRLNVFMHDSFFFTKRCRSKYGAKMGTFAHGISRGSTCAPWYDVHGHNAINRMFFQLSEATYNTEARQAKRENQCEFNYNHSKAVAIVRNVELLVCNHETRNNRRSYPLDTSNTSVSKCEHALANTRCTKLTAFFQTTEPQRNNNLSSVANTKDVHPKIRQNIHFFGIGTNNSPTLVGFLPDPHWFKYRQRIHGANPK